MSLKNSFQLSLYFTICFSSFMLALSEAFSGRIFNPQWLTIPFAILAYIYTEKKQCFHLSQVWVNIFGILAVVLTGIEFFDQQFGSRTESGAFAGAHLLVFLTWIVLFQKKENRQYWSLCVLSGLHVAVGAVLTTSGMFGFFIFVYLFFILWTLTIYSLFRDVEKYSQTEADREQAPGFQHDSLQGQKRHAIPSPQSRPEYSQGFGSVHVNRQERWINSRFVMSIFNMACLALVISAFFYFLIPRRWMGEGGWNIGRNNSSRSAISGFADEVLLGDFGEILTSNERVMQVRLYNNETDEAIDIQEYSEKLGYDEPLFRGKVLDRYSNGLWTSKYKNGDPQWPTLEIGTDPGFGRIRQEFLLEPIGTNILFAIAEYPLDYYRGAKVSGDNTGIPLDTRNVMLLRPLQHRSDQMISYEVFVPNIFLPNTPKRNGNKNIVPLSFHSELPGSELQTLKQLARQIVLDPNRTFRNKTEKALAITTYLKETGGFTYTLNSKIVNRDIDPIDDFLQRKTGHCEYFASALTLMLREIGIPARMVSGFKGGDFNIFSGYFDVEQRHAHVWVEAYLNKRFVVLDPTPAERDESVESMAQGFELWRAFSNYLSFLWGKHILGVSLEQQNKDIYNPLKKGLTDTLRVSKGRKSILTLLSEFLKNDDNWTGWKGALLVLAIVALLGLFYLLIRVFFKLLGNRSAKREEFLRRKRIVVEFYERFRAICEKMGLRREKSQTHLEFSDTVQRQLQPVLQQSQAVAIPRTITQAFYNIRFGEISLSEIQLDEIKGSILRLEQAISDSKNNGKR